MQTLFDYILKLSICLAVVYVFYQLVLRKLTFYDWNRWYLLGYTAFAFLIPLLDITEALGKNKWDQSVILSYIPVIEVNEKVTATTTVSQTWSTWDWMFVMLLAGMLVLVIKFAIRYFSFLKVRRNATLLADGDTKLFMVEKDIIPFSFGNSIFINNQFQDEAELKEIIRHEFVHVKQKHTHDIIWSELLCILNWYNPFVWLIRKAIRQNLEFIADNKVLEQGLDRKKYQYLLLKVTGNNHFSIANQFNLSSLKKRIAMMNKMKSARAQLIKFLFIVPLIAVMLLAFRKERNRGIAQNNPNQATWQTGEFRDSLPPPPPPPPYVELPAPPPPPPFKMPENVKSISINDDEVKVILKNGTTEKYDFHKVEEKKAFYLKYGSVLAPPPPPAIPVSPIPPGTVINFSNVHELSPISNVTTVVGSTVNAPVHADINVHTVAAAGVNSVVALTPVKENVVTGVVGTATIKSRVAVGMDVVSPVKVTSVVAPDPTLTEYRGLLKMN